LKEQYIAAIKSIMLQYTNDIGDDAAVAKAAEIIFDSGMHWVQQFINNQNEETIVNMVITLSSANTYTDKVTSLMTLAFVLGTTKMPTDVATALFDELSSRIFADESSDDLTPIRAMIASMYTTATHNSPF